MKSQEFDTKIAKIPRSIAVFSLTKVPKWLKPYGYKVGDRFYIRHIGDSVNSMKDHTGWDIGASYLKFEYYRSQP